jgi:NADH-quinone oxidoreductase subunit N
MTILLISALLGVLLLALEIFKLRSLMFPLIILSLMGILVGTIIDWGISENIMNQNMMKNDAFALRSIAILTILAITWFFTQRKAIESTGNSSDLYALLAFSFCGALLMTNFTNMVMLFLAIEILSIPLYVLAASKRGDRASNESGFKYFILGSTASAILLFGITLIYGVTGSFDLYVIHDFIAQHHQGPLLMTGLAMLLVGFGFKISAAPFHFWAPDVYQGAPTPITGWMATIVKGAAILGMYRLFKGAFDGALPQLDGIIAVMVAITLIVANGMAAIQTNVKRMMAYSGVSHAGFMLASLLIGPSFDPTTIFYYVLSYGIASLISFVVLYQVGQSQGSEDLSHFKGLAKSHPFSAAILSISFLSMAGIPPLAGFFGKYFVIQSLIQTYTWLTIVMILTSVVGMYYYLKVIMTMYSPSDKSIQIEESNRWFLSIATIAMVLMFFAVQWL